MPFPFLAVGAGLAALGAGGRFLSGAKQSKEAKKINPVWKDYTESPYARARLGLAQSLYGGRMAGAAQMERNIQSSQGSTLANIGRNATDASQALAMGAATQAQTDQSLSDLQMREAQNKYSMIDNLNSAYDGMVNEGDKVYDSMFQKFNIDASRKDALASAGAQNKYGAIGDLSSLMFQLDGKSLFGSKKGKVGDMGRTVTGQGLIRHPLPRNTRFNEFGSLRG